MDYHEERKDKSKESLEPNSYIEVVLHVLKHFITLLEYLENSNKSCELDKFIHLADPCDSDNLIKAITSEKKVKRDDCKKIDCEPAFEVEFRDCLSVCDFIKFIIVIGRVEDHQHIKEEGDVDGIIEDLPTLTIFFNQGNSVRSYDTGENQDHSNIEVPSIPYWILGIYQVF